MKRLHAVWHARDSFGGASAVNSLVLAGQVGARSVAVVFLVILGPTAQGTVGIAQLIAVIGSGVLGLGLQTGLTKTAAVAGTRADAGAAMWTTIAGSVLVTAAAGAVIASFAGPSLEVVAGLIALPAQVMSQLTAAFALGTDRRTAFAAITLGPFVLFAGALLGLTILGRLSVDGALVAFAAAFAVAGLASSAAAARWSRPAITRSFTKSPSFHVASRLLPGTLAQLANYRFDQVVIAAFLSTRELGLYGFSVSASEVGALPGTAMANIVLRRTSHDQGYRSPTTVPRLATVAYLLALPLIPVVVLLVELALPEYHDALVPFVVLSAGAGAIGSGRVLAGWLTARGFAWEGSRAALLGLVISVCANLLLIPFFGIIGASIASTAAYSASATLLLRRVQREASEPPGAAVPLA
jgi:O-antigen/teichoic acid export membrane protein